MKKKIVLISTAYVFVFLFGLISCIFDCGPFPNKFKTVGLDWYTCEATYSDTSDTRLVSTIIEDGPVMYNQFSIYIMPIRKTYFAQHVDKHTISLIQPALACSPIEPDTDEKIDSIIIKASKDFNIDYPAGSDLSDLFDIVVRDRINHIYDRFSLPDYIKTIPDVPDEINLILREPPEITNDFEFTVQYYQDGVDYDYFDFVTNNIVITINE